MGISKLIATGIFSGAVLAASLKVVRKITGNPSETLLYNIGYIPFIKRYKHIPGVGIGFHYATCVLSTLSLYYVLKSFRLEKIFSLMFWFILLVGEHYISSVL